jgi:hypothetical protein
MRSATTMWPHELTTQIGVFAEEKLLQVQLQVCNPKRSITMRMAASLHSPRGSEPWPTGENVIQVNKE